MSTNNPDGQQQDYATACWDGALVAERLVLRNHHGFPAQSSLDIAMSVCSWPVMQNFVWPPPELCLVLARLERQLGRSAEAIAWSHRAVTAICHAPSNRARWGVSYDPRSNRLTSLVLFELGMNEAGPSQESLFDLGLQANVEGSPDLDARLFYGKACAAWRIGDRFRSIHLLRRSIELYSQAEDHFGKARAVARLGSYLRLMGASQGALLQLKEARRAARLHGFPRVEALALLDLGFLGCTDDRLQDDPRTHFLNSESLFAAVGDQFGRANAWVGLCVAERLDENLTVSINYGDRALGIYRTCEGQSNHRARPSFAKSRGLHQLALSYLRAGRAEEAMPLIDEAIAIRQVLGAWQDVDESAQVREEIVHQLKQIRVVSIPNASAVRSDSVGPRMNETKSNTAATSSRGSADKAKHRSTQRHGIPRLGHAALSKALVLTAAMASILMPTSWAANECPVVATQASEARSACPQTFQLEEDSPEGGAGSYIDSNMDPDKPASEPAPTASTEPTTKAKAYPTSTTEFPEDPFNQHLGTTKNTSDEPLPCSPPTDRPLIFEGDFHDCADPPQKADEGLDGIARSQNEAESGAAGDKNIGTNGTNGQGEDRLSKSTNSSKEQSQPTSQMDMNSSDSLD
jgi:tetratricopeptide (TPR) repeat protein